MKYALVTGGATGIGKAIAIKIATDHGYHVIVNHLDHVSQANEVVDFIKTNKGSAEAIQFDISNAVAVEQALNTWRDKNKDAAIEVVVNNAGIVHDGFLLLMEEEKWDAVIDVKLKGFYNITKNTLQPMIRNRYGRIINIASLLGMQGYPGQVNYCAANGGLIAATKALAKEVGNRNITVNAIAPGFIKTDLTQHIPEEEFKKLIPAGRFGTTEEVADLASFLASKKASYINGALIEISGGF